jgi:mannose-6-phosphate isomerase-like protein (cupin superfamily)
MSGVTLVRATDAEVLADAPGSLITLLADSDTTDGAFTTNRATLRRGVFGTPAHFHTRATEFFFVLGGTLQVLVREDLHSLGKGESARRYDNHYVESPIWREARAAAA